MMPKVENCSEALTRQLGRDATGESFDLEQYGRYREEAETYVPYMSDAEQHDWALFNCLTHPGHDNEPTGEWAKRMSREPSVAQRQKNFDWLTWIWRVAILILLATMAAKAEPPPFMRSPVVPAARVSLHRLGFAPQVPHDPILIRVSNAGSSLTTRQAGLLEFACSTNMTCTLSGNTFTMTASSTAGTAWSSLTAPTLDLAMAHGAFSTTFTFGTLVGAGNRFTLQDTTGNTGTGYLWNLNTVGTSTLLPVRITAQGTANGVDMSLAGLLKPIGTGGIQATALTGAVTGATTVDVSTGYRIGAAAASGNVLRGNGTNFISAQLGFSDLAGSAVLSQIPRGTTAGQLLQSNGSGADPTYVDPIVSYNYVTLFTAQAATGTATSSAIRLPTLSAVGSLDITGAGITGSPAGCQIDLRLQHQAGASVTSIATQVFTPAVSRQAFSIAPAAANVAGDTMIAVYTCTTYPTAGTITVGFDPITPISLRDALPTGTNTIGAVTQASGPWTQNQTQLNSVALASPFDVDSGAGTQNVAGVSLRKAASGGSLEYGTSTDPLRIDPTGTTTQPVNVSQVGGTAVVADPCESNAKVHSAINLTANAQIIAGTAAKKTYVCAFDIVVGAATNVALVAGTGAVCATGISGIAGGTTAATGWNFAANGGMTKGNGKGTVFIANTAADNICLLLSAANQTSGSVQYVQQ